MSVRPQQRRLLFRHFFTQLFFNEETTDIGDANANVIRALSLVAIPGFLIAFFFLPGYMEASARPGHNWGATSIRLFFINYSMALSGFVVLLKWDMLFLDRRDYQSFTHLPISLWTVFQSKIVALLAFLGLFIVGANFFSSLLLPLIGARTGMILRFAVAHVTSVLAAGLFTVLVIITVHALLLSLGAPRLFQALTAPIQMLGIAGCVVVLLSSLILLVFARPLVLSGHPAVSYWPPFWFLGMYESLCRATIPAFEVLAMRAYSGMPALLLLTAGSLLLGYTRYARRLIEIQEHEAGAPNWIGRLWRQAAERVLRTPLDRAIFHFLNATMLRSRRHRLLMSFYMGIGIAFALLLMSSVRIGRNGSEVFATPLGLITFPLVISFFLVSGLRAACNIPAELAANWIFRSGEIYPPAAYISVARQWLRTCGLAPLFLFAIPFELFHWPLPIALFHLFFELVSSLLLIEILFFDFLKIPFTCSYIPNRMNVAVLGVMYIYGFSHYALTTANVEHALQQSPTRMVRFIVVAVIGVLAFRYWRRRKPPLPEPLRYEESKSDLNVLQLID